MASSPITPGSQVNKPPSGNPDEKTLNPPNPHPTSNPSDAEATVEADAPDPAGRQDTFVPPGKTAWDGVASLAKTAHELTPAMRLVDVGVRVVGGQSLGEAIQAEARESQEAWEKIDEVRKGAGKRALQQLNSAGSLAHTALDAVLLNAPLDFAQRCWNGESLGSAAMEEVKDAGRAWLNLGQRALGVAKGVGTLGKNAFNASPSGVLLNAVQESRAGSESPFADALKTAVTSQVENWDHLTGLPSALVSAAEGDYEDLGGAVVDTGFLVASARGALKSLPRSGTKLPAGQGQRIPSPSASGGRVMPPGGATQTITVFPNGTVNVVSHPVSRPQPAVPRVKTVNTTAQRVSNPPSPPVTGPSTPAPPAPIALATVPSSTGGNGMPALSRVSKNSAVNRADFYGKTTPTAPLGAPKIKATEAVRRAKAAPMTTPVKVAFVEGTWSIGVHLPKIHAGLPVHIYYKRVGSQESLNATVAAQVVTPVFKAGIAWRLDKGLPLVRPPDKTFSVTMVPVRNSGVFSGTDALGRSATGYVNPEGPTYLKALEDDHAGYFLVATHLPLDSFLPPGMVMTGGLAVGSHRLKPVVRPVVKAGELVIKPVKDTLQKVAGATIAGAQKFSRLIVEIIDQNTRDGGMIQVPTETKNGVKVIRDGGDVRPRNWQEFLRDIRFRITLESAEPDLPRDSVPGDPQPRPE